jgi:ABC-type amino acid transport substrate-binding protein
MGIKEDAMQRVRYGLLVMMVLVVGAAIGGQTVNTAYENVAPKFILNADGKMEGLIPELIAAISKDTGITFSAANEFMPKIRYELAMEAGTVDVFFGLRVDATRQAKFIFGEPLYDVKYILLARADDPITARTLDQLKAVVGNSLVMTVFQAASVRYLQGLGFSVDDGGRTVADNLHKLVNNRGRFFIFQNLSTMFELNQSTLRDRIRVIPVELESYTQNVMFSKKLDPAVQNRINQSIRKLKANGTWQPILDKWL